MKERKLRQQDKTILSKARVSEGEEAGQQSGAEKWKEAEVAAEEMELREGPEQPELECCQEWSQERVGLTVSRRA